MSANSNALLRSIALSSLDQRRDGHQHGFAGERVGCQITRSDSHGGSILIGGDWNLDEHEPQPVLWGNGLLGFDRC